MGRTPLVHQRSHRCPFAWKGAVEGASAMTGRASASDRRWTGHGVRTRRCGSPRLRRVVERARVRRPEAVAVLPLLERKRIDAASHFGNLMWQAPVAAMGFSRTRTIPSFHRRTGAARQRLEPRKADRGITETRPRGDSDRRYATTSRQGSDPHGART